MMKQFKLWMFAAILAICSAAAFTSCADEDNPCTEEEIPITHARVDSVYHIDEANLTVYIMEYPSIDPFGRPAMLSGTITIGDEVTADAPATGLLLYNHFTVYRADECPSRGELKVQKLIPGSGLITISADYYGFGITEDKQQAYCISNINAQASIDALLAAKELLPTLGYSWNDDILFNVGYSQGGHTAMGVVRMLTEKYPEIRITHTFAGGGSYDIPETYRQFLQTENTGMPSTVISVLLAYNTYFKLDIPRSDIFIEPLLSNIDEWVLSKKYTREEIDELLGTNVIAQFVTPEMLDLESDVSKRFLEAMDRDNLCAGWHPRKDERISLVHHMKDITVPAANTANLYAFLKEQGVENVTLQMGDFGSLIGLPAHESGAVVFAILAVGEVCRTLGIDVWFNIFDLF